MRLLEYLRGRSWYPSLVTSFGSRRILKRLPPWLAFRLLKRIGPVQVELKIGLRKIQLVTSSDDDHYLEALIGGLRNWESDSLAVWTDLCSKGGTVVDVGAYGGVYTALAIASGAERVVAYEPNPVMHEKLTATVEANHIESQVELRQIALSDAPGEFSLMVLAGRKGTSGAHLETAKSDPDFSWVKGPSVVSRTFEDEAADLGIKKISAMKIDVEGLETNVLRGAASLLTDKKPAILVECLSTDSLRAVEDLLVPWGYSSAILPEDRQAGARDPGSFRAGNFLFLPPQL